MPTSEIQRRRPGQPGAESTSVSNPIRVDADTDELVFGIGNSGRVERRVPRGIPVYANLPLAAALVDQTIFIAPRAYAVASFTEIHSVIGSDGGTVTVTLTKDTGTQAPGTGTPLLTSALSLKAQANKAQSGTLVSPAKLAAGDRLGL